MSQQHIGWGYHERRQVLNSYIEWRWSKGFGIELDQRRYRGLNPATRLIPVRLIRMGDRLEDGGGCVA